MNTGVVVHINEELDSDHQEQLSQKVGSLNGVYSADVQEKRPHLMIVDYDPNQTKSLDVLSGVNSSGVHAQLVGWI
ncbi:MAG: heavy-metal-associated domain-containing protein [Cocleimonas sp.]|nr:heavy-metal-associated domain-containing protein [Cocleimonas sp.]